MSKIEKMHEAAIADISAAKTRSELVSILSKQFSRSDEFNLFISKAEAALYKEDSENLSIIKYFKLLADPSDTLSYIDLSNNLRIESHFIEALLFAKIAIDKAKLDGNFVIDSYISYLLAAIEIGLKEEIESVLFAIDSFESTDNAINEKKPDWIFGVLKKKGYDVCLSSFK